MSSRIGRRLAVLAAVVATLGLAVWISTTHPDVDEQQRPFDRAAGIGARVDLRVYTVKATAVDGGAVLRSFPTSEQYQDHRTGGAWIAVTVVLTAAREPERIHSEALQLRDSSGRYYSPSSRFSQPVSAATFQPGIPVRFTTYFEVPLDAAGLHLMLSPTAIAGLDLRADIDLGVSPDRLRAWHAAQTPLRVEQNTTLVPGKDGP